MRWLVIDLIPLGIAIASIVAPVVRSRRSVMGERRIGVTVGLVVLSLTYLAIDAIRTQSEWSPGLTAVLYLAFAVVIPYLSATVFSPSGTGWLVFRARPDEIFRAFSMAAAGIRTRAQIDENTISFDRPSGSVTAHGAGSVLTWVRFSVDADDPKYKLLRNVARKFILYPPMS